MTNASGYDWRTSMAPKDGPYGMLGDATFSERNPGLFFWNNSKVTRAINLSISFQPELGASSCPTLNRSKHFLNRSSLSLYPRRSLSNASAPVAVGDSWNYHNYLPWTLGSSRKDAIEEVGSSIPATAREFADRAQLVQKRQLKFLFESFLRGMWTFYTGVLYWKSQSPGLHCAGRSILMI